MTNGQKWVILLTMYLLFLAIGIISLGIAAGWIARPDETFRKWSMGVLVADIAGACFTVFRTQFSRNRAIQVNLAFPAEAAEPESPCDYSIFDLEAKLVKEGKAHLVRGPGGWQCAIPLSSDSSDTARLVFKDRHGAAVYRTNSFSLNTVNATVANSH